ncbi:MAG: transglutaminase-like domain-containing protein [Prevotellaceae bacterium]|jgi:hypothetical protein|nr:transglutaminase-like domain-containing protein [Prevotellaceae bacterium]
MKEIDLNNIVNLLDDPDAEVYRLIATDIMSRGVKVVPIPEKIWYQTSNPTVQRRIEGILHEMQEKEAMQGIAEWVDNGATDILEGAYWIAKFRYPGLNFFKPIKAVEAIKMSIWLSSNNTPNPFECISFINQAIYEAYGFSIKKQKDALNPNLCYINYLLGNKVGNSVSIGVLYFSVAQRLHLSVYGVCVPGSFILCYKGEYDDNPVFYINTNNYGQLVREDDIVDYISHLGIEFREHQIEARDNKRMALRILETLVFTYGQAENNKRTKLYRSMLTIFGQGYELEI